MQEYCTAVSYVLHARLPFYAKRMHYVRNVKRQCSFSLADHIWRGRARLYESAPEQIQVEEILQEAPEGRLFAGADRVGGRRSGESSAVAAA